MRLSLIGPGDIEFHFQELLKIKKDKFENEIREISRAIAESGAEIVILPDKGISFQIAKLYKQQAGKRVIAAVPKSDNVFGIKHLEPCINEKLDNKPIFDEIINTENWYKHDLIIGLLGNAVLYLGNSPGTNGELNYATYLYKIITKQKENLEILKERIHPEIRADENYTIFVYFPFILGGKLSKEDEVYMKEYGIKLIYIKNPEELKQELKKFQ
jgi:hypothetical protein